MRTISHQARPLNILAILGKDTHIGVGLLSALRSNHVLICRSVRQAEQSAAEFGPDVVIVDGDTRLENSRFLSNEIEPDRGAIVLFRLSDSPVGNGLASNGQKGILLPTSAADVELLLSRISMRLDATRPITAGCA